MFESTSIGSAVQQTFWGDRASWLRLDKHRQTLCLSLTCSHWNSSHDIKIEDIDLSFALSSTAFTRNFRVELVTNEH